MLCGHGQPLLVGYAAQGDVRAFIIVGPHPLRSGELDVFQVIPVILG